MKTSMTVLAMAVMTASQVLAHCGSCGADSKVSGDKSCADGACASVAAKADSTKEVVKEKAHPAIEVAALATLLKAGTPLVLLDARSGKWDDGRRIPGARSLNAGSSDKDIAAIVPAKDTLVVTYCANLKCQASPMLAKHLRELGYTNVIELPEGIDGWAAAGQKVEKVK
jgi:rhodanese-related sulfurtransferase